MGGRGNAGGFTGFRSLKHEMTGTEKQIAYANKCLDGLMTNVNAVQNYYQELISDAKARDRVKTAAGYQAEYDVIKKYQNKVFDHARSLEKAGDVIDAYKGYANGDMARMSKKALAGMAGVLGLRSIGVSQFEVDAAIGDAKEKLKARQKKN